ncbi:hypothetical protein Dsin_025885 [Dipteronia sinensis]|uniref:Uncharacterized protein n=1 Tax=Dipteronia sinensis TaxID=43782 RepID=A0AAD9ZWZ4_9ROSI|nr:hypothetical protein Dsin_025885 [Dipteronia sinensis]
MGTGLGVSTAYSPKKLSSRKSDYYCMGCVIEGVLKELPFCFDADNFWQHQRTSSEQFGGFNCEEAADFGTPQWLNVAKEAAVRCSELS